MSKDRKASEHVESAMSRRTLLRTAGLFGAGALPFTVTSQDALAQDVGTRIRTSLRPAHPRLHLDREAWRGLRQRLDSSDLKPQYEALRRAGDKLIDAPAAQYKLIGPRLLRESRRALKTISTLAGIYHLDGDRRYAERARQELLAICAFPSWHPPHFLDVAEMTNAAGLGYDWLYDVLSPQERQLVRSKIVEFGLRPGLTLYQEDVWWSKPFANNWGQVCAGGLTVGALAILNDGEDDPGGKPHEPEEILRWTTSKVRNNMMNYAPDGGWPEGPAYWSYATHYTCTMISALESCLGVDFGLSGMPGFSETGLFRVASIGPSGLFFNYADGGAEVPPAAEMVWLGNRFQRALFLASEQKQLELGGPSMFHLVWSKPARLTVPATLPPLDLQFTKVDVAYLRSSWTDPDAFFIGIKGGNNAGSHAHLDLGSFVLDALGERWALDLGPDNYDLPDYFGKLRWTYYRLRTEGHNTLTLGLTENQALTATAALGQFSSSPRAGSVAVNLQAAYPTLRRPKRTVMLERTAKPRLILEDSAEGGSAASIRWNMHTDAQIALSGSRAVLSKKGKKLLVTLESPAGASFAVTPASAPLPQAQQPQVQTLIVDCASDGNPLHLRVSFTSL